MKLYCILQTARKMYVREQSREENFQGQNHVFILHHAPFVPVSDNRMYKIYKSFLEKECPDLPHYRLHDLRHTYFTLCTEIGFSELSIIAITAVLMEGISSDIPSFTLLTKISWELYNRIIVQILLSKFYCKQEKLFV